MVTLFTVDEDGLGSPRFIIMVVGPVASVDNLKRPPPVRGERCAGVGLLLLVQLRCTLLALGLCSCMVS